jgi:hypothetical protein
MGPFAAVVDAQADIVVTAADFEDAFRQLPELLSADFNARKLRARHLLNVATSGNHAASSAPEPGEIVVGETSSSSNSSPSDPLDLATAAFTCQEVTCNFSGRGSYLFGWDDIAQHHCKLDFGSRSLDSEPCGL